MAAKWLSIVGATALVACGAAGIAALLVVPQRVTLVVAEERADGARGPDPTELLRADVAQLREDLGALSSALGPQLQQLHDALDAADSERSAGLREGAQKLREGVAALDGRVAQLERNVQNADAERRRVAERVERSLESLVASAKQVAEAPGASADSPADVAAPERTPDAPAGVEVPPSAAEVEAVAKVEAVEAPSAPEVPTEAAAPKRAFLAFSLPSQAFSFQGRQRLAVVPSLSRVGFDAKSTLHDFSGVTQKVEGEFEVDLAAPQNACSGAVRAEAKSLDTGMADRDKGMRDLLGASEHAQIAFVWTSFRDAKVDADAQRVDGVAVGRLTIKGVEREVAMPVRVSVDASKRVAIEGEMKLALRDFGLEPPSQLGMIRVENEMKVWIALRARSLGAAPTTTNSAATNSTAKGAPGSGGGDGR
jgi:polyisoprenoid-binding protein YceI